MKADNIIIIEDNQDDFEALGRGFKSVGLNSIDWYRSAHEALNYFNSLLSPKNTKDVSKPRLVMLDLNMPGVDGRKLLEIIKSTPQLKSIPVIVFSTSSNEQDITQCYASGANTYIQKPVKYDELKQICSSLKEYWYHTAVII
jgi:two-component system response regulator